MKTYTFALASTAPFRLDLTVWALRRRDRNIVDRWDGMTYRRVLSIAEWPVEIAARQAGTNARPKVEVTVRAEHISHPVLDEVSNNLARMLGLNTDLTEFYALAARDRRLAPLAERFRGLKPPRFPTLFEALVNAFACQQLSLTVGIELLGRLARQCGPVLTDDTEPRYGFPRPADTVRVKAQRFRSLGFSYSKARSILDLSRSLMAGKLDLGTLERMDENEAVESLMQLRGVGRWTAEYVLLRGLGKTSVFPGDDVGARNRLAGWLGRKRPLDYDAVKRALARWYPHTGLVYFHLLLAGLSESGELDVDSHDVSVGHAV